MMRQNAAVLLALVVISVMSSGCLGADVSDVQVDVPRAVAENRETISERLIHMRHLLKSLFVDWNFGESNLKGALARTFGRMRLIRKIMLPLAFIGGFMTAVIISIKMTGLINMLMIKKVLLLQMALILGKMIYGFKELLMHKHDKHQSYASPPQAYYIPVSHSSHGGWNNREDDVQPNYYSGFNEPQNYPHRPQLGPYSGYAPQATQQVREASQFSQPYYQGRTHDYTGSNNLESIDSQALDENGSSNQLYYDLSRPASTINSLSPQEMTKLLSDTLARVSQRTTPSPIYNRSPNIRQYFNGNRS